MSITSSNRAVGWFRKDSILDVSLAIRNNFHRKEVNLINTIKSCLRDDELTLQGIKEERNKAKIVFDVTKLFDLGLLHIFILQHGIELARLQRSKLFNSTVFEGVVVNTIREVNGLSVNAQDNVRQAAIADAVRLFAKSNIQFVKDYDPEDLRFNWQAGWI